MYRRIGTYEGRVALAELADQAAALPVVSNPTGYQSAPGVPEIFQEAIEPFIPGKWMSALVVIIQPGGFIPLHSDDYRVEQNRVHLVLQTNDACWSFHDGGWENLEAGGIYTLNPFLPHGSLNWGDKPRIHLMVDILGGIEA